MSVIIEYVTHFTCEELVNVSSVCQPGNREQWRFSNFLGYIIKFKNNVVKKSLFTKGRKVVFKKRIIRWNMCLNKAELISVNMHE